MSLFPNIATQMRITTSSYQAQAWEGIDETVAKLFHARGSDAVGSHYDWKYLPDPLTLKNMEAVLAQLVLARNQQKRIVIVGDYDSDGATSISIMMLGLGKMGYQNLFYVVPHRFVHGYGLTALLIPEILKFSPDMVITVDNGIQSVEAVDLLKAQGIEVIITDHHLPGPVLPDALIVNPNQGDCPFADKHIAGCGVAWYVMVALRSHLKNTLTQKIHFNDLTILAAIGTVADCVQLTHVNRIIIQNGLNLIRLGHASTGLKALMDLAKVKAEEITSIDIAFRLAPRLNAAGRLEDMSLGVQCLMANDRNKASVIAMELDRLNALRQDLQQTMEQQALEQLILGVPGAVVFHAQWHQGIVGLIASRVRERLKRPVIAFAWDELKGCYKGSGRSTPGIHLKHILDEISLHHPELMINFGGHAMAVGLSVKKEHWPSFGPVFTEACARHIPDDYHEPDVIHDGWIEDACLTSEWFQALYRAHPFGQGFEEPVFMARLRSVRTSLTKGGHQKIEGRVASSGSAVTGWVFKGKGNVSESSILPEGDITVLFQYLSGGYQLSVKILAWIPT